MTLVYLSCAHPKIVREIARDRTVVNVTHTHEGKLFTVELDNDLVIEVRRASNSKSLVVTVVHAEKVEGGES